MGTLRIKNTNDVDNKFVLIHKMTKKRHISYSKWVERMDFAISLMPYAQGGFNRYGNHGWRR